MVSERIIPEHQVTEQHAGKDQAPEQHTDGREWAGVQHLFSLVRRFPLSVACITLLCGAAGFVASTRMAPSYESTIYLGLQDWGAKNPVLDGLSIPTGTQDTKDAYSLLRSQEVLSLVVSSPKEGQESFRLGLTTQVQELPRSAWQRLQGFYRGFTKGGDLHAQFLGKRNLRGASWRLYFESDTLVWVAPTQESSGGMARIFGPGLGPKAVSFDLSSNTTIELEGVQAELKHSPGMAGRTFSLRWQTPKDAIADLRRSIKLGVPTERNQVLRIAVQNSQEDSTEALAQALSAAFLHFEAKSNLDGAKAVVAYLDGQLLERKQELGTLDELISLRRAANVDLLQPAASLAYLQTRRMALAKQVAEAKTHIETLTRAQTDLALGNNGNENPPSIEAAGRASTALADPRFDRWLDRIDQFDASLLEGISVTRDPLKLSETQALERVSTDLREAQERSTQYDRHLATYRGGDDSMLSALLEIAGQGEGAAGGLLKAETEGFRKAQTALIEHLDRFTEKHPSSLPIQQWLEVRRAALLAALEVQNGVLSDRSARAEQEVSLLQEKLAGWPEQERGSLVEAKQALWVNVRTAIDGGLTRAQQEEQRLRAELVEVEARYARLPQDQSALELPILEREGLHGKVDLLIAKREDAEIALAGLRPTAKVIEPASRARFRQPHMDLLGTFAGFLVGIFAALTLAQFRLGLRVGKQGQLEKSSDKSEEPLPYLELPVLARMPQRLGDHNFATGNPLKPDLKGMAFAALRRLRVQLNLMGDRGWNTSLLGVVGLQTRSSEESIGGTNPTASQEGGPPCLPSVASASACGLALTHVLAGKRVLLVDACVGGANLSASLGLATYPGLLDCLAGESRWQQNTVKTRSGNLDILPAGCAPHAPDSFFSNRAWTGLLADWSERYDIVLLRLPDLGEAADLHHLTPKLGGVLVAADPKQMPHGAEFIKLMGPLRRTGTRMIGLFQANRGSAAGAEVDAEAHRNDVA